MTKAKKTPPVDFLAGLASIEENNAVRRLAPAKSATPSVSAQAPNKELPPSLQIPKQQPSRRGKVALTHWVDPAVRKQLARMAIDLDSSQADLVAEALNMLFEKYGQPPIAAPLSDDHPQLEPTT